jgi:hypothetical protein
MTGFSADAARHGDSIERYQLAAAVAGSVACAWMDRGDEDARVAMGGARDWQVLKDMVDEGDYAEVLWEVADRWLAGNAKPDEIRSSLGCE